MVDLLAALASAANFFLSFTTTQLITLLGNIAETGFPACELSAPRNRPL
jgi:hypothetical protein